MGEIGIISTKQERVFIYCPPQPVLPLARDMAASKNGEEESILKTL